MSVGGNAEELTKLKPETVKAELISVGRNADALSALKTFWQRRSADYDAEMVN